MRLSLFFVFGLCLLAGMGYFYKQERGELIPRVKRFTILYDKSLKFGLFVIPIKEHDNFSFISLSIDFEMPNKEIEGEVIKNKDQLRGIIYDMLTKEINKKKELPSLPGLKESIIKEVNKALNAGKVNTVYVREFLAV